MIMIMVVLGERCSFEELRSFVFLWKLLVLFRVCLCFVNVCVKDRRSRVRV